MNAKFVQEAPKLSEPDLYLRINPDGISLEVLAEDLPAILVQLAKDLRARRVKIRYEHLGRIERVSCGAPELLDAVKAIRPILEEGPVVIELGTKGILYVNGGGCLLLETAANGETKKMIVTHLLKLCGFTAEGISDQFTAMVKHGELKVLRP